MSTTPNATQPNGAHNYVQPSIYRDDTVDGVGPTVFKDDIEDIVVKAKNVASDILSSAASNSTPAHVGNIHIGNSYHGGWLWSTHNVINIDTRTEKERSKGSRWAFGAAFAVVALVTSYFMGRDWGISNEAGDEIERVQEEREYKLFRYRESAYHHPHWEKVYRVLEHEEKILERIRGQANTGIALKAGMLTASAVGIAGAVVASPALMVSASIAAVVTGCGMLFRSGYSSVDRKSVNDAEEIRRRTFELEHLKADQRLIVT